MTTDWGIEAFERHAAAWDAAVGQTSDIDRFCARSEWVLSFHEAFVPNRRVLLLEDGGRLLALAERASDSWGRVLETLESMWGLATPLVGPNADELITEALAHASQGGAPPTLVLTGVPPLRDRVADIGAALPPGWRLGVASTTTRRVADLTGGVDGWLSRRSRNFRRALRKAEKRAAREGITFERTPVSPGDFPAIYARVVAIERASWKGLAGRGAESGQMRRFYERMIPRLLSRDGFRLILARRDGRDVGYVHGGTVERHFRGFQFSFTEEERTLSLGNILQLEMIRWLAEDGFETYDLGTDMAYKTRWAEQEQQTLNLIAAP